MLNHLKAERHSKLSGGCYTDRNGHFDPKGECIIGSRYKVIDILNVKGQTAVLVQAQDEFSGRNVVIKVLHACFYDLGIQESQLLLKIAKADPDNHSHIVRLLRTFTFDNHYCLVFEPLIPIPLSQIFLNIPAHRKLAEVRHVGLRLLAAIGFLHQQNLIHADLKPDNILLKYEDDLDSVHVADFGNAINYVPSIMSVYYKDFDLQTPLYRAPEVIYGLPFGPEIDMWSLGCILAELVIAKPLFLSSTMKGLIRQITSILGPFPAKVFKQGKFFRDLKKYTWDREQSDCTQKLMDVLQYKDIQFADLIRHMLSYSPEKRITVSQAARHPFFASYFPLGFLSSNPDGALLPASELTEKSGKNKSVIQSNMRKQLLTDNSLIPSSTEISNMDEMLLMIKPEPKSANSCSRYSNNIDIVDVEEISAENAYAKINQHKHVDVRNFDFKKKNFFRNTEDRMVISQPTSRNVTDWAENLECEDVSAATRPENIKTGSSSKEKDLQRKCSLNEGLTGKNRVNVEDTRKNIKFKDTVRKKFRYTTELEKFVQPKSDYNQRAVSSQEVELGNGQDSQTLLRCSKTKPHFRWKGAQGNISRDAGTEMVEHEYQSRMLNCDYVSNCGSKTEVTELLSEDRNCMSSDNSRIINSQTDRSSISACRSVLRQQDTDESSDLRNYQNGSLSSSETVCAQFARKDISYSVSRNSKGIYGSEKQIHWGKSDKKRDHKGRQFSHFNKRPGVTCVETDSMQDDRIDTRTFLPCSLSEEHFSIGSKFSPRVDRKRKRSEFTSDSEDEEFILLSPQMQNKSNSKKLTKFQSERHTECNIKQRKNDEYHSKGSLLKRVAICSDIISARSISSSSEKGEKIGLKRDILDKKYSKTFLRENLGSESFCVRRNEKKGFRSISHDKMGSGTVSCNRMSSENVSCEKMSARAFSLDKMESENVLYDRVSSRRVSHKKLGSRTVPYVKLDIEHALGHKMDSEHFSGDRIHSKTASNEKLDSRTVSHYKVDPENVPHHIIRSRIVSQDKVNSRNISHNKMYARTGSCNKMDVRNDAHDNIGSRTVAHNVPRTVARDSGSRTVARDSGSRTVACDIGSRTVAHDNNGSRTVAHDNNGSRTAAHDNNGLRTFSQDRKDSGTLSNGLLLKESCIDKINSSGIVLPHSKRKRKASQIMTDPYSKLSTMQAMHDRKKIAKWESSSFTKPRNYCMPLKQGDLQKIVSDVDHMSDQETDRTYQSLNIACPKYEMNLKLYEEKCSSLQNSLPNFTHNNQHRKGEKMSYDKTFRTKNVPIVKSDRGKYYTGKKYAMLENPEIIDEEGGGEEVLASQTPIPEEKSKYINLKMNNIQKVRQQTERRGYSGKKFH